MSSIGPSLPPHLLAKRKRQEDEISAAAPRPSPSSNAADTVEKKRKVIGPTLPPHLRQGSDESAAETKPARTDVADSIKSSDDEEEDDSDEDFGPSLAANTTAMRPTIASISSTGSDSPTSTKPQRDGWMTMAPDKDNLGRMDPARPRPRGFNTSKSAKGPTAGPNDAGISLWNETPEQKRQRLQDEMMGISKIPQPGSTNRKEVQEQATKSKVMSRTERKETLMEQHASRKAQSAVEVDDDPSARVFDRDKDMGAGLRVGQTQRRQMLNQAANSVASKFAGGGYL